MAEKAPAGYPVANAGAAGSAYSTDHSNPPPYQGPPPTNAVPTGVVAGQPAAAPMGGGYVPNAGLPVLPDGNLALGTSRRAPMQFICAKCGFTGASATEETAGTAAYLCTALTLGLAVNKLGRDVTHTCPQCKEVLGVSKYM